MIAFTDDMKNLVREHLKDYWFSVDPDCGFIRHPLKHGAPFSVDPDTGDMIVIDYKNKQQVLDRLIDMAMDSESVEQLLYRSIQKPYRVTFVHYLHKGGTLTDSQARGLFIDTWVGMEFTYQIKPSIMAHFVNVLRHTEEEVKDGDQEIVIYRGVNGLGSEAWYSWTTNKEKAIWFATRWDAHGTVFEGTVKKKDILFSHNERDEEEVFVDYPYVTVNKKERVTNEKVLSV
jgi:hypothetical protein